MFGLDPPPLLSDEEIEALTRRELSEFEEQQAETALLPRNLDEWEPGLLLAMVLASHDPSRLDGHDRVTYMKASARQVAHDQARYYNSIGLVAKAKPETRGDSPEPSGDWYEFTDLEIRAALNLTRRAADSEIGLAYDLLERHRHVWSAMSAGTIDLRRARTIVHGTSHLSPDQAVRVSEEVLPHAPQLTTGQLRALVQRRCLATSPEDVKARLCEGLDERRLHTEANLDGTASLMGLHLPPQDVAEVNRRITGIARRLLRSDDPRTMDQLRADVFVDLLRGGETQGKGGTIEISTDLETLAGLSESPGELAGYGPVVADIARQVAAQQQRSEWRFVVTDGTGRVLHTGTTRRRPKAELRRDVLARYPTCVAPGCRMPASQCDLDHRVPWSEGGATTLGNIAPLCRHDHVGKHEAGWKLTRLPDGRHQWTSRLGHRYVTGGKPP